MYNEDYLIKRILALEYQCYSRLNIGIEAKNVKISTDYILADITLNFDGSKETLYACQYPKRYFEDCMEKGDDSFNPIPYNTRYEKIMKKLRLAEMNEEGVILVSIKDHLGRITCYYRWMNQPPTEGYAPPLYYAGILSDYMDEAERYLNQLYLEGVG